ncbi:TonB-dependent receptor domain-containing protein [Ferruginibacter sp.]|nr:TonB-dependent receptor [Ferruginibacter sp.]
MKKFFNLLVASTIVMCSQAQTNSAGKVTGSIKDGGQQKVIDAASVSLLKAKDSSLVKVAITDKEGNFIIENVKDGSYLVLATSVGHTKTYSKAFIISPENLNANVGMLQLIPVDKNLAGVTVVAKKPFIERKADRTIVNVEASISSTGSTALEVLEKAPGVTVDKDGNISLKGKQGVMIMVDGKPTYLSGPELTNMLRNMSSNQLDQIEIMTNPSAKYDASGRSGIINIKTKKNKQKGFNGSASTAYTQGIYSKTSNSLNLNYKSGKVNLFSTLSANYRNNFQELDIYRRYTNNDKTTKAVFEQNSFSTRHNGNYNAKIGADFYVSKKTTLGIVVSGVTNPQAQNGESVSYLKNSIGAVDSIVQAISTEHSKWKNGSVNFNFRHILDSTGRELTADVDYLRYNADKNQNFFNNSYTPDWTLKSADNLVGELPSDIKIYAAKIDYIHPLKKGAKIESGVKFSFVETDNTAGYFNVVGNVKTPDYDKTNRFDYKENINAAYLNFNKEIKKWSIQTGLRLENTNYEGHQFGNPMKQDSAFKRSYTSLFPTLFMGYNPTEKNQFSFSYGRRINRPDYEDLNPFLFFLDKYTYGAGNPFLKPMYSDVLEASHTYKQFLTTTINYSYTRDLFNEIFRQEGFATVVSQGNYGLMNDASISVSAQIPVEKWWNMNVYTEAKYNQFKGLLYGDDVDVHATTFLANVSNQFKFNKGWSAELSGWYRTKGIEGQIAIKSLGQMTAGVQKQVLKNKGTLKLNVNDVLRTRNPRGDINFQNTEASFKQYSDNRTATISFSYRFGKPIKGLQKRKTGGAGDEQNRVKGAN